MNYEICKGAHAALQFGEVLLELNGIVDAVYFILCYSDVGFCDLNCGVVEDFVQEQQAFCTVVVLVVYITPECFSECVRREVPDSQLVVVLELFEHFIHILDRYWSSVLFVCEDVCFLVRTTHQVIQFFDFALNRWVERYFSGFARLLFRDYALIGVQDAVPCKVQYI